LLFSSSSAINIIQVSSNNIAILADEETKQEERPDANLEAILFGSGSGLVVVGGVGAGIIAHNNKKPKMFQISKAKEQLM
jgi:hypothetical protein